MKRYDWTKLIPDANAQADRLAFMGPGDKQGSAYLRSALLAVIKHFNVNAKSSFIVLPKEVCEGFLNGVSGKLNFTQGLYSYQGEWKCALNWLHRQNVRSVADVGCAPIHWPYGWEDVGVPSTRRCLSKIPLRHSSR